MGRFSSGSSRLKKDGIRKFSRNFDLATFAGHKSAEIARFLTGRPSLWC